MTLEEEAAGGARTENSVKFRNSGSREGGGVQNKALGRKSNDSGTLLKAPGGKRIRQKERCLPNRREARSGPQMLKPQPGEEL